MLEGTTGQEMAKTPPAVPADGFYTPFLLGRRVILADAQS